jgi:hypothetical protein
MARLFSSVISRAALAGDESKLDAPSRTALLGFLGLL